MAAFPSITPDYSLRKGSRPNTRVVRFNDGYEQRSTWLINQNPKLWNLKFSNISESDSDTIEDFLNARAEDSVSFQWIPPDLTKWAASTAFALGAIVQPLTAQNNGLIYEVTTAGTSGSSEPTWPSSGTVTDGGVTWTKTSYEWVCEGWQKQIPYLNRATISATFRQVFEA